jgi:hypothetical protein
VSYSRILGTVLALACSAQLAHAASAPQPSVHPLMQKDVADAPGKELVMITVD